MLRSCPALFEERVIHGDRFAQIADVEINRNADGTSIRRNEEQLGRGATVVFVKTDFVPDVFATLRAMPDPAPFVLITHNSDIPVTRALHASAPAAVVRWYALNVAHEAPDLIPIPSGMERPHGGGYSADSSNVPAAWSAGGSAGRDIGAFACWNGRNNFAERAAIRTIFEGRADVVWQPHGLTHREFLQFCGRSRFVVSPPGNGIDCHRTWEAMYMGAIPLVRRSPHTSGFRGLPMVLVDDWESLTAKRLANLYEDCLATAWNHEPLFFEHWEARIRRDAASIEPVPR